MAFSSGSSPMVSIRSRMASMRAPLLGWKKRASSQQALVNQPGSPLSAESSAMTVSALSAQRSRSAWT